MKVLLVNGSPHREGNTFLALSEVARALQTEGVDTEIVSIGTRPIPGCIACGQCAKLGHCAFNDRRSILPGPTVRCVPCSTACSSPARTGWPINPQLRLWCAAAGAPVPHSTG